MSEILEPTAVIEMAEQIDYSELLANILASSQNTEYALQLISGFLLFFVIVVLCYFCYKFFRIFF